MCWSTLCAADLRPGPAFDSIYATCPKHCGRRKRLLILMTTRRVNGGNGARKRQRKRIDKSWHRLATGWENLCQLLRSNDFELSVGAVTWLFVLPPSAELRCMTEPVSLHVIVSHFHHQFGSQRFPR